MRSQIWVSPNEGGGWRVHKSGASRDIAHFQKKSDAINRATEIARNQGIELKIKRNLKIYGGNSYGSDPFTFYKQIGKNEKKDEKN